MWYVPLTTVFGDGFRRSVGRMNEVAAWYKIGCKLAKVRSEGLKTLGV